MTTTTLLEKPKPWNTEIKPSLHEKLMLIKQIEARAIYKILEIALEEYIKNHYPQLA